MGVSAQATRRLRCALLIALAVILWGCNSGSGGSSQPAADVALSGTIDIETGTRVDADTAAAASRLSSAQPLPREFVLAGFVSARTGEYIDESGAVLGAYQADPRDAFSMNLRPGQTVYLQAFPKTDTAPPLTLSLLKNNQAIDSATVGSAADPIRVVLPETEPAGMYQVQVEVSGGAPLLYVLSSSIGASPAAKSLLWPDYDFAAGEAIVVRRPSGNLPTLGPAGARATATLQQELSPGVWLMKMPVQRSYGSRAHTLQVQTKAATLAWIRELEDRPDVISASPNYTVRALQTPVDEPFYNNPTVGQQWHYELIKAPIAWQLAPDGGAGVTVAVLDTGLYGAPGSWHSELHANVELPAGEITDFVSPGFDNDNEPGRDTNPADPGNAVGASRYHGTHVAGTIAAVVNGVGGAGIAYNASLLPVRVLGEGGEGSFADLLAALNWVGCSESGNPKADIVNLSLGGLPYDQRLKDAIDAGVGCGIVYVAAAGNSASAAPAYPAAYDNVFSVNAVDGAGDLASYSNYGDWVDLAAPGGDAGRDANLDGRSDLVSSTSASRIEGELRETYIGLQGTSMAAPHVSGVFALMKGLNPELDYGRLRGLLRAGELTSAACGEEECRSTNAFGRGLLDAGKAVLAASSAVVPDLLTASPAVISLSTESHLSASVTLSVFGNEPRQSVTIDSISTAAPWLKITQAPGPGQQGSEFVVNVALQPAELTPGVSERTSLVVQYSGEVQRQLEIPVTGLRVTDQQARDAGRHFVLLVDPESLGQTYTTVAQTSAIAENGVYRFAFVPDDGVEPKRLNEVPPGDYILVAGSDLDNDGLICHEGEACAEYPVAGLRQTVRVQRGEPLTGLHMTTSYFRPRITEATPDVLPRPGFKGYRLISPAVSADHSAHKTLKGSGAKPGDTHLIQSEPVQIMGVKR